MPEDKKRWDVFISHASEDKDSFVRPIVLELAKRNVKVWYDEFSLEVGSSLKESIEKGIRDSRFGLVVLSKSFFLKRWPKKELNAIFTKELIGSDDSIIPIWYNITMDEVYQASPMLADIVAISNKSLSIDEIARKILLKISILPYGLQELQNQVKDYLDKSKYNKKRLILEMFHRLDMVVNFEKEAYEIPVEDVDDMEQFDLYLETKDRIRGRYKFPLGLYEKGEPFSADAVKDIKRSIKNWVNRKNTDDEIQAMAALLFGWYDVDMYYVLFGFPNEMRTKEISSLLNDLIFAIGRKSNSLEPSPELHIY